MINPVIIGNATLYHADCRDILPMLTGKFDSIVTDPPSGINFTQRTTGQKIIGDESRFDISHIVNLGVLFVIWGENYFDCINSCGRLIWLKRAVDQAKTKSYSDAEIAWTNAINQVKVHRQISDGCIREGEEHGIVRVHPFQKPISLMKWCLSFLKDSTVVFDPYMGSGTTGVAAVQMDRKFIGIEIDSKYFDIACKRIEDAQRQQRMF